MYPTRSAKALAPAPKSKLFDKRSPTTQKDHFKSPKSKGARQALFPADKAIISQKAQQPPLPADRNTSKRLGMRSAGGIKSPMAQKDLGAKRNAWQASATVKTMQVKLPPSLRQAKQQSRCDDKLKVGMAQQAM